MIEKSRVFLGDNRDVSAYLAQKYPESVNAVITSPPYAMQRKNQYGGVSEGEYAQWTVEWMEALIPLLTDDASVFINIRPHIKNGVISDYVLKTRLALRDAGWYECEELIWYKPDSPPLGSVNRPRRSWESVLWFSRTNKPFVDCKRGGNVSNRIGFEASKFDQGGASHIHAGQNTAKVGQARVNDVIVAGTSRVEKGVQHPAMYPREIADYLIKLTVPENGVVYDPFAGSFTTCRAAIDNDLAFFGAELNPDYYYDAERYTLDYLITQDKQKLYEDFAETALIEEEKGGAYPPCLLTEYNDIPAQ